jgi:quercetin dioxygenase-like cupin family protein
MSILAGLRRRTGEKGLTMRAAAHLVVWAIGLTVLAAGFAAYAEPPGILPDEIKWTDNPTIPPGGQTAVLAGNPGKAGPFAFRFKMPAGYKIMPHTHPEDRMYTVISGVLYIGLGDHFDATKLKAYPQGSFYVMPANVSHFHWAMSGETIAQVNAIGPTRIDYLDPADDPRNK